jgi:DNA polymerase-3 subunit alpha
VKFDFLGLRNLTIIDLAVRYIKQLDRRSGTT